MYSRVILITGDRNWEDYDLIYDVLKDYSTDNSESVLLIHGECKGADNISGDIAKKLKFTVNSKPANWKEHGRAAGPIRNLEMIKLAKEYQDKNIPVIVLAFHDDLSKSKGTKHCVESCIKKGLKVELYGHYK